MSHAPSIQTPRWQVPRTVSVILIRTDSILLVDLTEDRTSSKVADWIPAGATPATGESQQACAARETAEQTGQHVLSSRCLMVYEVGPPSSSSRAVEPVLAATAEPKQSRTGANRQTCSGMPFKQLARLNCRSVIASPLRGLRNPSRGGATSQQVGRLNNSRPGVMCIDRHEPAAPRQEGHHG